MEEVPELIPLIFSHILSTAPLPLGIDWKRDRLPHRSVQERTVSRLSPLGERPPLVGAGFSCPPSQLPSPSPVFLGQYDTDLQEQSRVATTTILPCFLILPTSFVCLHMSSRKKKHGGWAAAGGELGGRAGMNAAVRECGLERSELLSIDGSVIFLPNAQPT